MTATSQEIKLGDYVNFWDKQRGERLGQVMQWVLPDVAMVREEGKQRGRRIPVRSLKLATPRKEPAPVQEERPVADGDSSPAPAPPVEEGEVVDTVLGVEPTRMTARAAMMPVPVKAEVIQDHQLRALDVRPEMIFSPDEAKEQLQQLQRFVHDVMIPGVDYGQPYPGAKDDKGEPKKVLLKAGAEKLLEIYGYYPETTIQEAIEDWTGEKVGTPGNPFFFYRVKVNIMSKKTGLKVGEGVGSCNSWEKKYRWRDGKRVCPNCGESGYLIVTKVFKPGDIQEWLCWKNESRGKLGCGSKFALQDPAITQQQVGQVPNPDMADMANTVLKMAKKRGHVDGAIGATRSSDLFTQDIEDLEGVGETAAGESGGVSQAPSDPPRGQEPPKGKADSAPSASPPKQQSVATPAAAEPSSTEKTQKMGSSTTTTTTTTEETTFESEPNAAKPTTAQYKKLNPLISFFGLEWERSGDEVRVTFPDYALEGLSDHGQTLLVYAGEHGEPHVSQVTLNKIIMNLENKRHRIETGQEAR